jgi:lipopolysaccharide/colanic/teichoic acid biosynthesis glycosyltransferase
LTALGKALNIEVAWNNVLLDSGKKRVEPMSEGVGSQHRATPSHVARHRIFDLGLLIILIPFWLPVLLVIGLAVLVRYGHPALYRSTRIGRGGIEFTIWKFRTLGLVGEPLGQFALLLRRTHLDELPQFWNVLFGSMALVGPRPLVAEDHHSLDNPGQRELLRPGMTGPWQVARTDKFDYSDMERLDRQLLEDQTLALRWMTLARTALLVLGSLRPGSNGR